MIQSNQPQPPAAALTAKPPEAKPPEPEAKKSPRPEWKRRSRQRSSPVLRFAPTAWAKLLYFRDRGPTEIGGFAVTAPDDLLYVEQFVTVKQGVTAASISFDDEAVADFFDGQVDAGRRPEQFARIWLHSHPGECASPSSVDEETFARAFGGCQWALMFIVGQTGKTTARLRFNVGPGAHVAVPVEVDYSRAFGPSDLEAWEAEYQANIHPEIWSSGLAQLEHRWGLTDEDPGRGLLSPDLLEGLREMEPAERQLILAELAADPDFSDNESQRGQTGVIYEF
ncbi:MAG: hypothetical protein NTV86_00380 [Planctomycetota bacterium]|nr:hypothetical protein [Planctomycetota bacterium]